MTLWSDLETDLDNLFDALEAKAITQAAYEALLAAPTTLPAAFDDLATYATYVSDLATWEGNVAAAKAAYDADVADEESYLPAILARIPIYDVKFKIAKGGTNYYIWKTQNNHGEDELLYEVTT